MGTGTMSNQTERITGLAGDHDYAVLDIREVNGKRLLLVKNPWCDGTSWKGAVAAHPQPGEEADGDSHTAPDDDTLVDLELSSRYLTESNFVQYDQNPTEGRSIDQANADKLRPGIFWIDLGNVFQHFESIYLNWHPGLFNWRENIHFEWDLSKYTTHYLRNQGNLCDNPQLRVSCAQGGIVWLLLDRHIRDRKIQSDTDRRKTTSESLSEEFISLYAFKSGGKRVYISDGNTHQGPFVDAPQTLLPMEFEPETPYTIVPLEQGLSAEIRTFTLSVFSHNPVAISWASDPHAIHKIEAGAWTAISAGGNTHSKDYLRNPQYTLTVDRKTSIALILMSPMKELNLNVKLMHCGRIPARIKNMARRDIIVDSGDYRPSCALACFSELDAGTYAIICSTFEAKQLGMFTLRVDTNAQTTLRKLPPADAGQLHKKLADASFRQGTERIAAPIAPERLIRATFTVQHIAAFTKPMKVPSKDGQGFEYTPQRLQTHSLVQISVELGRGPQKRILVASSGGQHADASQGVRTEDVDLSPELLNQDKLWLVIDRMSAPYDAAEEWFKVEMSCDVPDALVVGVWRTWGD
ncbi:MAG: cysteine protease [Bogoriella megaspora]|nr:MAG: cysteine protease [Bogoriella megaspora]